MSGAGSGQATAVVPSDSQDTDALPGTTPPSGSEDEGAAPAGSRGLVATLCLLNLIVGVTFSLIAPFLPTEALKKGVSQFQVGVIFAAFPVVLLLATIPAGVAVEKFGARWCIIVGSAVVAVGVGALGVLEDLHGGGFVAVALALRFVQGAGAALSETGMFVVINGSFKESMGQVMGITETANGLGTMLGPVMGGFLFELGGFYLPPLVVGVVSLLLCPILAVLLPKHAIKPRTGEDTGPGYWQLLTSPTLLPMLLVIVFSFGSLAFLEPLLAPHLEAELGLTPTDVGLMFGLACLVYCVGAPVSGYVSDKGGPFGTLLVGMVVLAASFLVLGPSFGFIPLTLGMQSLALCILGFGAAASLVPAMPAVMKEATRLGDDSSGVGGKSSALLSAAFSVGEIMGPIAGSGVASAAACSMYAVVVGVGALLLVVVKIRTPEALGKGPGKVAAGGGSGDGGVGAITSAEEGRSRPSSGTKPTSKTPLLA